MYELQFFATDDADWAQRVDLIDDATNLPLATAGVLFELEVSEGGARRLPPYFANRRAPATHPITATVTSSMAGVTVSPSSPAASASPKNGCNSCNWPTAAMPPCARPRYQNTKPISMLNSET